MPENPVSSTSTGMPVWPSAREPVISHGQIKTRPEDFQVIEHTGIEPDGQGEHLWLRLRKRDLGTPEMCKILSDLSGVKSRDIGYAGLKDKFAVTEQWVSVLWPIAQVPDWLSSLPDKIELLLAVRHGRKLRKGALKGNQFRITIREVVCDDRAALQRQVEDIRQNGFPNYFTEQRFGREGGNIAKAKAMFSRTLRVRDRFQRGMFLSAARSYIFNQVLAERIRQHSWNKVLNGELCILDGSRQYFLAEAGDPALATRLQDGDIHPSGPLWGDGEPDSQGEVLRLEKMVADTEPELVSGLADARMDHDRRALRVVPSDLEMGWEGDSELKLSFGLPSGAYATALLRELIFSH